MLEIDHVCKAYHNKQVLLNTNMKMGSGIRVLLGINGCGKSTLLRVITGVIDADSGSVKVDGKELLTLPPEQRRVGYVPQHTALFNNMSVYGNIVYGLRTRGRRAGHRDDVDRLIDMLELGEFLDCPPRQLSGGYKSRVSLARALAPQPCLMLLDEPLSDVDVVMKERLLPEFKRVIHSMGIPSVYVTHDPAEAEQVGDSFSAMVSGTIYEMDSAKAAFDFIRERELERLEKQMGIL